eukprot:evm.model.scf_371.2 EVM.evm.TU.scf_371.2   scf_371:17986-30545(+)
MWAVVVALLAVLCAADPLDDRINANEDIVRRIQEEASALYAGRKSAVPGCECSVHACASEFRDSLVCSTRLGAPEACASCDVDGMRLDMKRTLVRTPPGADLDALSNEVIESICTYQSIDDTIVATGPDGNYTWTYIGTTTGVMRIWPGMPRERGLTEGSRDEALGNCRTYDPRIRPWFIAASSGPKDVVVLLDTSEQDDPLFNFLDYTRFLAWGRQGLDVIWSNFYIDDAGLGNMTTAAMPIYSPGAGNGIPGLLVGVVGKDVLVSQLQADDEDFKGVVDRIIERTSVCYKTDLSACQYQVLRGDKAECPDTFPPAACYHLEPRGAYFTMDPSQKLPYDEADLECLALGGRLAEFNSKEEQMLVSGLASREGSWIGLSLRHDEIPLTWRWIQSGDAVEDPLKSFASGGGEGEEDEKEGGRGGTLAGRDGQGVFTIDRRHNPVVPSISDCRDYEMALAATTKVVRAARKLDGAAVLCPFGDEERTTEEVQCCCSDVGCVEKEDGLLCTEEPLTGK